MASVNTNTFSMNAQRQLMKTEGSLQTAMQRLSSGLRINSAKDDAAGLQIANRMSAQVGGIGVAMRNANDGISLAQTAEGAMEEITSSLLRMRDLALQSASGTYDTNDQAALNAEYQALNTEITRIVDTTEFNGQVLLKGGTTFGIAVDYKNATTNNISIAIADIAAAAAGGDITDVANSQTAMGAVDTALQLVDTERAKLGASQNRLTSTVNNLANVRENLSASRGRVMDADFATETANLSKAKVMQQAGTAMLAQANAIPQNVLALLR